jgi:hypothetical protein
LKKWAYVDMQVWIQPRPLISGMAPPWSLTIYFPIPSNIDEMSILATLQPNSVHSSARKEKDQHQEISGFESPSYSMLVFYILITVARCNELNRANNIQLW